LGLLVITCFFYTSKNEVLSSLVLKRQLEKNILSQLKEILKSCFLKHLLQI